MTETLVIVNPAAGRGRASRVEPEIARFFSDQGHSAEFIHSQSSAHAREQAHRAARRGTKCVAALGGDGMFHYVVEGVLGTDCIVGFLPAGNGNDIAKGLGIFNDPVRAAKQFLETAPRAVDVVCVRLSGGQVAHFIGAGGMGLDAEAAFQANTRFRRWPGILRYLAGALWTFRHEFSFELQAEIDGIAWSGRAILAAVANSPSYGSGIRIASDAKMDDGLLSVVLVEEVGWLRLIQGLGILVAGRQLKFQEIKRFRGRRVRLEANRAVRIHGDGEQLGESPAEFEVLPGAIRVKAP